MEAISTEFFFLPEASFIVDNGGYPLSTLLGFSPGGTRETRWGIHRRHPFCLTLSAHMSAAGAPSSAGGAAKASRSQRRRANREAALDRAEREGVLDGRSSAGRKRLEQVRAREASTSTGTPPSQARSKANEPPTADDDQVPVRDRSENNSPGTAVYAAASNAAPDARPRCTPPMLAPDLPARQRRARASP